jgi:hypothetical protein
VPAAELKRYGKRSPKFVHSVRLEGVDDGHH